jgi:putative oxidoreductase
MKAAALVARLLLGLVFTVFGLNGFLHFMPNMPMPQPAVSFFTGLAAAPYMLPLLFATQVLGGVLLLIGIFVPLALLLLAPVIVNIVLFHAFLVPGGLPMALVVLILALFLAWTRRDVFGPVLRP